MTSSCALDEMGSFQLYIAYSTENYFPISGRLR